MRLLIVEDEPLIRSGIRDTLRAERGIDILGECDNCADAVRFIQEHELDLVLLDVRLPDGSGLDVVQQVGAARMPTVIFVTAYEEYAVRAFDLNAVDYLLKPFDGARLLRSIDRARERLAAHSGSSLAGKLEALLESRHRKWPERFAIPGNDGYQLVEVDVIDWIESADNYVRLHSGPRSYLLLETLNGMERKLDPDRFARVHRRLIVNIGRILKITPMLNGVYALELRGGSRLTTGRQFKEAIRRLIAGGPNG